MINCCRELGLNFVLWLMETILLFYKGDERYIEFKKT